MHKYPPGQGQLKHGCFVARITIILTLAVRVFKILVYKYLTTAVPVLHVFTLQYVHVAFILPFSCSVMPCNGPLSVKDIYSCLTVTRPSNVKGHITSLNPASYFLECLSSGERYLIKCYQDRNSSHTLEHVLKSLLIMLQQHKVLDK